MAAPVRIRILRNSFIEGQGKAKVGEEFEVSPYTATMLVSDGSAEYVTPQTKNYVTMTIAPDHGDPAPRKVGSAPPKVKTETWPTVWPQIKPWPELAQLASNCVSVCLLAAELIYDNKSARTHYYQLWAFGVLVCQPKK